jgi:predicted metal-dependent hydrolase
MPLDVREGIRLLQSRRWYAAHEAIEAGWIVARGDDRAFLQGLIHAAVSFEHLRRGNPRGAASQWRKAETKLGVLGPFACGIDVAAWCSAVREFFASIDLDSRVAAEPGDGPVAELPDERTWPVPSLIR